MTHLTEDTVLDLIHGLTPAAAREGIAAHLATCPACEELLRRRAAERERLRAAGGPESARVAPPAGDPLAARSAPRAPRLRRLRWVPVAGLAAAATIAAVFITQGRRSVPPPEPTWLPAATEIIEQRSQEAGDDQDLALGLEAYARRDLDRAVAHLQAARADEAFEHLRRVYLGSALAQRGDFAAAARVLESVDAAHVPGPWLGEARWNLYVALGRSGMKARADSLREALAREPGELGARARGER